MSSSRLNSIARPMPSQPEVRSENSANRQPGWLTDAVATVVHAERGRTKAIAAALRVRENAVYEVADINNPRPLKAWWIPEICRETGSRTLLEVLAAQIGCVVFCLPPVNPHVDQMNRELARTLKQFGEFIETNGDVLSDGVIDAYEAKQLLKTIDTLVADLAEYRGAVERKAAQDAAA